MVSLDTLGIRNNIDQASTNHNYLTRYEDIFAKRYVTSMAIVLGTRPVAIANTFAEHLPDSSITVASYAPVSHDDLTHLRPNVRLVPVRNVIDIHRALAPHGPYDVLIEDSPNRKSQKREIFKQFFPRLRNGGLYIAEDLHANYIPSLQDDDGENLWELVSRLLELKGSAGRAPSVASRDELYLAEAILRVEFDGKLLCIQRRGDAFTKLRHAETDSILQEKYGSEWGRVIHNIDAHTFTSDAVAFANRPDLLRKKLPDKLHSPEILVRQYKNVTAYPRQILVKDALLLPDTFRLSLTGRLNNTALDPCNHYHARLNSAPEPIFLPGEFYYLDLEYNRHFGHFMTEAIPRLYGWDSAKESNPDMKLLISSPTAGGELLEYQLQILLAYGMEESDIRVFTEPHTIESLVSPMPLFHNGKYVHPHITSTYRRLSDALSLDTATPRKIFVSRKPGMWRECLNMSRLEEVFTEHGFTIVYPEDLSLREQVTLFANVEVVGGYIGSSLYNTMFSRRPIDIIAFVNTSYQSTNEYFIATALGHRLHMFWCDDIIGNRDTDSSGRPLARTNYDFEFDFGRDGKELSSILGSFE